MKTVLIGLAVVVLAGCTDARNAKLTSFGSAGEITCYSGESVIYKGRSTGKIETEEQSDGWFFKDAQDNKLVRVSGDCVIRN